MAFSVKYKNNILFYNEHKVHFMTYNNINIIFYIIN